MIAQYNGVKNTGHEVDRVPQLMRAILIKSLLVRGFIEREFEQQRPEFIVQAQEWLKKGHLKYREDITEGLENAPEAFIGLLQGKNFGKVIIRL